AANAEGLDAVFAGIVAQAVGVGAAAAGARGDDAGLTGRIARALLVGRAAAGALVDAGVEVAGFTVFVGQAGHAHAVIAADEVAEAVVVGGAGVDAGARFAGRVVRTGVGADFLFAAADHGDRGDLTDDTD